MADAPQAPEHEHSLPWCAICDQFWEDWDEWFAGTYPRSTTYQTRRYTRTVEVDPQYL